MARATRSSKGRGSKPSAAPTPPPVEEDEETIEEIVDDGTPAAEVDPEAGTVPGLERAAWTFNRPAAEEALKDAIAAGADFRRAEKNLPIATRNVAVRCYDLITELMPDMTGLRRAIPRIGNKPVSGGSILPEEVLDFLEEHHIPAPHFRCSNPFHGVVQAVCIEGAKQTKWAYKDNEAARLMADATAVEDDDDEDLSEEERKKKEARKLQAERTAISRIGKWVLAAVDKGDKKLITNTKLGREKAVEAWRGWQRDASPDGGMGKTIAVVEARTGRKSKADIEAAAAAKREREEQERNAAEARKMAAGAKQEDDDEQDITDLSGAGFEDDSEDSEDGEVITGVAETEDDLDTVTEDDGEAEPVPAGERVVDPNPVPPTAPVDVEDGEDGETVELPPAPVEPPLPERRFHALPDHVAITIHDAELLDTLPDKPTLMVMRTDEGFVVVGWEG